MDDTIFNPNDYKPTNDIVVDELDDRYVNTEGDTMNLLNVRYLQVYDNGSIAFPDTTIQSTAFNDDAINTIYENVNDMINNNSNNNILSNNNKFTGINTFDNETLFDKQVKIYDIGTTDNYTSLYYSARHFNIENIHNNGTVNFLLEVRKWHYLTNGILICKQPNPECV